jgi:uncharacterized protein (DUF885 family)
MIAEYGRFQLDLYPESRIQRGLAVTKLPDFSYEGAQKDVGYLRALRKRLARLDSKGLSHEDWLSREILDWDLAEFNGSKLDERSMLSAAALIYHETVLEKHVSWWIDQEKKR